MVAWLRTHIFRVDHSKSVSDLRKMGIPVITPYEGEVKDQNFGGFYVRYFGLTDKDGKFVHSNGDGSECAVYGFLIMHDKEPVKLIYATDCQFIKWRFKDITDLILGVDYVDQLVTEENRAKNLHIYSGHLNLKTACDFIRETDREHTLNNVIVGHMSDTSSSREIYRTELEKATFCKVHFAERGKSYELLPIHRVHAE